MTPRVDDEQEWDSWKCAMIRAPETTLMAGAHGWVQEMQCPPGVNPPQSWTTGRLTGELRMTLIHLNADRRIALYAEAQEHHGVIEPRRDESVAMLLAASRDNSGLAAQILVNLGVTHEQIVAEAARFGEKTDG